MGRYDDLIAETIAIQEARQAENDYYEEIHELTEEYKQLGRVVGINDTALKFLLKFIIDKELSELQLKDIYEKL